MENQYFIFYRELYLVFILTSFLLIAKNFIPNIFYLSVYHE